MRSLSKNRVDIKKVIGELSGVGRRVDRICLPDAKTMVVVDEEDRVFSVIGQNKRALLEISVSDGRLYHRSKKKSKDGKYHWFRNVEV